MMGDDSIDYQYFFQELLEAGPWPMLVIDRRQVICSHNQLASRLLGSKRRLSGSTLADCVTDHTLLELVQTCIEHGQPQQGEYDKETSNASSAIGSGTIWKVSVTPLAHTARVFEKTPAETSIQGRQAQAYSYFAITIEDLSELRRMERVRRDLIANISHELRTPLATVRLLAETLEDAIDTDREKAQEFLEKIETEVQYLTGLVSELLELSRIESGLMPMMIEPVKAEHLVREVMARMLSQAQRHRVSLRTDIRDGNMLVAADSKQISRVLVNLVHNALKFTPSGGSITIGTHAQVEKQRQIFFVADTGVGIQPEVLPRIFERFYKADRARSKIDFIGPGGGGSGLGLAIARHVVEAHQGRIDVESTVGQGSTFSFTLPVVK